MSSATASKDVALTTSGWASYAQITSLVLKIQQLRGTSEYIFGGV
jgi:hypothetical protein